MWIDWNNNGSFVGDVDGNGNPAFYSGSGVTMSPVNVVANVKTPQYSSSISLNNYKIRIIVSDQPVTSSMFNANITNGEVEDYLAPALILPVTFGNITAEAKNCNVYVGFTILTQQNSKQFEIEYSKDGGRVWSNLAIIAAKGNTNTAQSYSYIHTQPVGGSNLYRIKNVDLDGRIMYSPTASAISTCVGKGGIVSYPNPVQDKLTLLLPLGLGKTQVKVINGAGQAVITMDAQSTVNNINTSLLAAGLYLIQVTDGKEVIYTSKFIKE